MSHMRKEIGQQPDVVRQVADVQIADVAALAAEIKRRDCVLGYLAARGTSDNAAIYGKYLLEIENALPVALAAPSVFTLYDAPPRLGRRALVLGISQSGAGPDVIEVIRRAREWGALTACIVNVPNSPLAQEAEYTLHIGAGREVSVAATKTYTGALALLALLSGALQGDPWERARLLAQVADTMAQVLAREDEIAALAQRYHAMQECIVLGRGFNQATAAEAALKLTETCYIGARAYSAADFQHGPIAQVAAGLPCLLFAPDGKAYESVVHLMEQLRARHPALICFARDPASLPAHEASFAMPDPVPEWASPLVYIVAAQLFACHLALARGNDPDEPRGLTKVTQTR